MKISSRTQSVIIRHLAKSMAVVGVALALAVEARANDTTAELSVGGLTFLKSAAVTMESEELSIDPSFVRVKYVFRNITQRPVVATVAFPLPSIDLSDLDANVAIPASNQRNFVGFRTLINGKVAAFQIEQRALLAGKDVTGIVKAAGLPILLLGAAQRAIGRLSIDKKSKLIAEGLLVERGASANGAVTFVPGWMVATSFVRHQTFPTGVSVVVAHGYRTSLGIRQDTLLRMPLRSNAELTKDVETYKRDYCVDDKFLAGIDKLAGTELENRAQLQERRVSYVLQTGANWAGPIKSFTLAIDTGGPDRLMSVCFDNIKPVSPTRFEAKLTDFTPQRDLKILLVGTNWK